MVTGMVLIRLEAGKEKAALVVGRIRAVPGVATTDTLITAEL